MATNYCETETSTVGTYRRTEAKMAATTTVRPVMQEFDFARVSESVNLFYTVGSMPSKKNVASSRTFVAPRSRSLFYLSAGFGVFSAVVTGFALVSESVVASSISAFALCGALISASAWLERIKRERG